MSNPASSVYQIVAIPSDNAHAEAVRARLGNRPFHIGSGENANLQLDGDGIAPIHIRVLLTGDGRVILTNLGEHKTIALDGASLNAFVPTVWLPGDIVRIGNYELQLVPLTGSVSQAIPSAEFVSAPGRGQSSNDYPRQRVDSSPVDKTIDFASDEVDITHEDSGEVSPDSKASAANDGTMIFQDMGDEFDYDVLNLADEQPIGQNNADAIDEQWRRPSEDLQGRAEIEDAPSASLDTNMPIVNARIGINRELEQPPTDPFGQTPLKPIDDDIRAQIKPPHSGRDEGVAQGTVPRVWYYAGYIGAQLLHSPLRLVAGERVRMAISVQNRHNEPLSLYLVTAGMPRDWLILPVLPITLAPREIRLVDLIIMTPVTFKQTKAELLIRLSDTARSDTILTLNQEVVFKNSPNIIGHLQPVTMTDREPGLLYLQNHTQSSIQVFITHHLDAEDVLLKTGETQFNLPPGQVVSVPLQFEVRSRPMFAVKRYRFAVVVAQNRRASLDFPGEVVITPRIRLGHVLLLLATIFAVALIGLLLLMGRDRVTSVVVSPSSVPSSLTSDIEQAIPFTAEPTKPPS